MMENPKEMTERKKERGPKCRGKEWGIGEITTKPDWDDSKTNIEAHRKSSTR
jgi:hypothetical protein